jgi:hypothetical protein
VQGELPAPRKAAAAAATEGRVAIFGGLSVDDEGAAVTLGDLTVLEPAAEGGFVAARVEAAAGAAWPAPRCARGRLLATHAPGSLPCGAALSEGTPQQP